ncbi:hypothetical protein [Aeromicrobium sp. Sec7.5]|uniref:hypothetical protein n=1 Tax=Aeromicrobium sp. Sec7.5 TaxID=3121276 RepID=UPI002FE4BF18
MSRTRWAGLALALAAITGCGTGEQTGTWGGLDVVVPVAAPRATCDAAAGLCGLGAAHGAELGAPAGTDPTQPASP